MGTQQPPFPIWFYVRSNDFLNCEPRSTQGFSVSRLGVLQHPKRSSLPFQPHSYTILFVAQVLIPHPSTVIPARAAQWCSPHAKPCAAPQLAYNGSFSVSSGFSLPPERLNKLYALTRAQHPISQSPNSPSQLSIYTSSSTLDYWVRYAIYSKKRSQC